YRTLVLRRGPAASRPPSVYRRVWHGRRYDVWQRPPAGGRSIVEHLPLGNASQAGGFAPCAEVLRLSRLGSLAAVTRAVEVPVAPSGSVTVPRRARYQIWVEG